LKDTSINFKI